MVKNNSTAGQQMIFANSFCFKLVGLQLAMPLGFLMSREKLNGIVVFILNIRVHRLAHTDNLITWSPLSSYIQPLVIELQYQLLTSAPVLIYLSNQYKELSFCFPISKNCTHRLQHTNIHEGYVLRVSGFCFSETRSES